MRILKAILGFFNFEKTAYSHRHRSIETIAREKGIDIDAIRNETRVILEKEGRVRAIHKLTHRFHVPLSTAWGFVDKLDNQ